MSVHKVGNICPVRCCLPSYILNGKPSLGKFFVINPFLDIALEHFLLLLRYACGARYGLSIISVTIFYNVFYIIFFFFLIGINGISHMFVHEQIVGIRNI